MIRLSLAMVVCNEAHRLPAMFATTRPYLNEAVIVVQPSTDNTLAVARGLADIVIEHPAYGFSEASRGAAIEACTGDWVLLLDADEQLSLAGRMSIRRYTQLPFDWYNLRRQTTVDGRVIEDMPHPRLFRRGHVISPPEVHTLCVPMPGSRGCTIALNVMIEHHKTTEEQRLDDERYERLKTIHQ